MRRYKSVREFCGAAIDGRLYRLLRISRTERRTAPVFIVGAARSGTTLLYRLLQHHPSFALRPPSDPERNVQLTESRALDYIYGRDEIAQPLPKVIRDYMVTNSACADAFADAVDITAFGRAIGFRLPGKKRMAIEGRDILLHAFVHYARAARGCVRLVEKTPQNARYIEDIHRALPAAKMLFLARHPIDVLSSYYRVQEFAPEAEWSRISVDDFCRRYEAEAMKALSFAERHPDLLRVARYEHLTRSPGPAAEELCAFLGEPFLADMLDLTDHTYIAAKDPLHSDEIKSHTKDWRDYLANDVAASVQRRLTDVMQAIGYEPISVSAGHPEPGS